MSEVNYITHLNTVFEKFLDDNRLNPTHVSLYMALFQVWNSTRFPEEFFVIRDEIMQQSKIGSKSTYHRCLKELDKYGYIEYQPSHNPYRGSKIKLTKNWTTSGQVLYQHSPKIGTSSGQALVPKYKHNKTVLNNINSQNKNFKNSDKEDFENESKQNKACTERSRGVPNMDNLKVSNDKNYNEPL